MKNKTLHVLPFYSKSKKKIANQKKRRLDKGIQFLWLSCARFRSQTRKLLSILYR